MSAAVSDAPLEPSIEPIDDDAVRIVELSDEACAAVYALIIAASEDDAVAIALFVFAFTFEVIPFT